jgi:ADP-ribosylation factor protein 6
LVSTLLARRVNIRHFVSR